MDGYPHVRLRRLRRTENLRQMVGMPMPPPSKFMWPIFIIDGENKEVPIEAMPGQSRYSVDRLPAAVEAVVKQGVTSVLLFGVPEGGKDPKGKSASDEESLVAQAIRLLRNEFPDLLIATDVCVCAYTDHGHCGILNSQGEVDNDDSLAVLAGMALTHARCGADIVAPSAMMDGQIQAIRTILDEDDLVDTLLMSYSTKFASSMYGPFREAAHSAPGKGDRRGYQAPYNDPRQALRESYLDIEEGADILMVKPSLLYMDLIRQLRDTTDLPLAAYNVSGEYSMLVATAQRGWGDLRAMVRESTLALARSGTDILISYWAKDYQKYFGEE